MLAFEAGFIKASDALTEGAKRVGKYIFSPEMQKAFRSKLLPAMAGDVVIGAGLGALGAGEGNRLKGALVGGAGGVAGGAAAYAFPAHALSAGKYLGGAALPVAAASLAIPYAAGRMIRTPQAGQPA